MHRPSYSGAEGAEGGGGMREEAPISPAGSLRGRSRALLTQPVADTVLTWGQQEAGERTPTHSSGEDTMPSPTGL